MTHMAKHAKQIMFIIIACCCALIENVDLANNVNAYTALTIRIIAHTLTFFRMVSSLFLRSYFSP